MDEYLVNFPRSQKESWDNSRLTCLKDIPCKFWIGTVFHEEGQQ